MRSRASVGSHVGIVFQSFHLIPTMTALENVAVPLELAGRPDAFPRAAGGLEAVGLGGRMRHYPSQLSAASSSASPWPAPWRRSRAYGGGRAHRQPGRGTGRHIMDLLFAAHQARGTTLVLVTHDGALAARCGRVVRLRSGAIEADEARATLLS